jgi:hypothetical protein
MRLPSLAAVLLIAAFGQATSVSFAPSKVMAKEDREAREKEIVRLEQEYVAADLKGDNATTEKYESRDLTFVTEDGQLQNKRDRDREQAERRVKLASSEISEMKARVFSDDAVLVTGKWTVKGMRDGKDLSGVYRYTDLWVKHPDGWKIEFGQATRVGETK